MRCFVELHVPNVFGQCLNDRIFVKRRFRLYLCFIILVIIWTVYVMKSVLVSTRRENLTISPVTTPYLDRIVSFESVLCDGSKWDVLRSTPVEGTNPPQRSIAVP